MAKGHIFIGIPTADQSISTGTAKSIYRLTLALQKIEINTSLFFAESADIIENRNILAAYFLESDASHLLCIDSDISFEPQVVGDFINLKKPFVGAAYPKRKIDMRLFGETYAQLGGIEDPNERYKAAQARASQFPFVAKRGAQVKNGFALATGIPAGLMLTERSVFTTMIEKKEKAELAQLGSTPLWSKGGHHGFFDRIWIPKHKYWLSEDLSFCHRWAKLLGEEILAYIGPGVTHHGNMAYNATYLDYAKNRVVLEEVEKQRANEEGSEKQNKEIAPGTTDSTKVKKRAKKPSK